MFSSKALIVSMLLLSACGGGKVPPPTPPPAPPSVPAFIAAASSNVQAYQDSHGQVFYYDANGTACDPALLSQGLDQALATTPAPPGTVQQTDLAIHVFICMAGSALPDGIQGFSVSRIPIPGLLDRERSSGTYCDASDCYVRGFTCLALECGAVAPLVARSWGLAAADPAVTVSVWKHEMRFGIWQANWPGQPCPQSVCEP